MRHLLLVVPARNEEENIEDCLDTLAEVREELLEDAVETEVLVVVNNNTDRTLEYAMGRRSEFPWLRVEETDGKGKGLAILHGWSQGRDLVAFTDADLAADITKLRTMTSSLTAGKADIVVSSRYLGTTRPRRGRLRAVLSLLYRSSARIVLQLPVRDAQCGLKAATYQAIVPVLSECKETGWLLDSEILFHAQRKGLRILEVPVDWQEGAVSNLRPLPVALEVLRFFTRLRRLRDS